MATSQQQGMGAGCLIGGLSVSFVVTSIIATPLVMIAWLLQEKEGCGARNPEITCRPWAAFFVLTVALGTVGIALGVWALRERR